MFRIVALPVESFASLFDLSDEELAARGVVLRTADEPHAFPCRVSLVDAAPGEELLLLPFTSHDVATPYRESGPIFVRRGAQRAAIPVDTVPDQQRRRLLSVRAYDARGWMHGADVTEGRELEVTIARFFSDPRIAYLHVHNARPGCFSCRVDRA